MRRSSPVFRGMLRTIGAFPEVRVMVAPLPETRPERPLLGITTFGIGRTNLVASIRVAVDYRDPNRSLEALAHEFAHVVEASCVADVVSTADLASELRRRSLHAGNNPPGAMIETPFAVDLGRRVMRERAGRVPAPRDEGIEVGRCPQQQILWAGGSGER
ncbi:MAG TPA: hypothetical protein VM032_07310 [Vicinamibacterales bacterium]|nr:hypothetical protein [Vicinamibacterales bacterium]